MTTGKPSHKSIPDKNDAIALLKADHRQVEEAFEKFSKARDNGRRQELARQICNALTVHTTIEEEIFYPAFLAATNDTDVHHEAEVEHSGAKKLIAEIEASAADDEYFKAKLTVLSEMIKHHVAEEEKRGGMFSEARHADMDLVALGEQLASRKAELEEEEADGRKGTRVATPSSRGHANAEMGDDGKRRRATP
ncbi:MAG: hemerythrin domain-containing protein [Gammaproteobacteria bacterium]